MQDKDFDRDEYNDNVSPASGEEVSDDDLDLSELLQKYMLEPQDGASGADDKPTADPTDAVKAIARDADDEAEEIDANVYKEFASEVYSDEDARQAAKNDSALLDDFAPADAPESDGLYPAEGIDEAFDSYDKTVDYSYDDGVFGDNEGATLSEDFASAEFVPAEDLAPTGDFDPADDFVPAGDFVPADEFVPAGDIESEGEAIAAEDFADAEDFMPADEIVPESELGDDGDFAPADELAPEDELVPAEYAAQTADDAAAYAEDGYEAAKDEATGDLDMNGLYVDGSEYADDLADLSAFAEGDAPEEAEDAAADGEEAADDLAADESEETADFVDYEAKEAEEENIDIDENVDSTDINLMLAFGLDDELERTMGAENAQRLTEELDEEQRKRDEHARKTVDNEYMNRSQTAGIAKDYKRRYTAVRIKLAIAAVLSLVLFFYENLRLFRLEFTGAFDATVYPTVYIMGSLQIFLLIAACAYEQIFAGFVRLFKGTPDHRSVTAIAAALAVVYSAVLPTVTTIAHKPVVLNFAVALVVLFTLISEYYNVRREIFAFNVVSSKKPKHVITKGDALESGVENADGDVLKFETAAFVDGFFTRTNEPVKASKTYAVAALVIAFASAAICGIVTGFVTSGAPAITSTVENVFSGFFIALPVSMMIAASYPFYRAARDAYDIDGAIIGECSLEEYSDAACVTFDDIGVFPSYGVRVQNVKIYNNHRIDRVLYYAASVFSVARGPLTDVFDMATVEIGHSDEVRIRAAGSGYLSATVDDKNITFGSAAELITRGFDIPENVTDEDDFDEEDVSVMYMFREDRLMAKLFIKYTLDGDFETIVSSLCEEGISVSIKTYDPNIDRDLIASGLSKPGEYSYSVTRYDGADDGSTVRDNADSGIVSRSSAKTLLQLISACTKVLASRRSGTIIGIISAAVASIILAVVIATGSASTLLPGRMSAIIAIYQLFWLIPTYINAKIHVR